MTRCRALSLRQLGFLVSPPCTPTGYRHARSMTCMRYGRVHWRTVKSAAAHPYIAIFELGHPVDQTGWCPEISWWFRSYRVDRQTDRQSHKRTILKTIAPSLRGWWIFTQRDDRGCHGSHRTRNDESRSATRNAGSVDSTVLREYATQFPARRSSATLHIASSLAREPTPFITNVKVNYSRRRGGVKLFVTY